MARCFLAAWRHGACVALAAALGCDPPRVAAVDASPAPACVAVRLTYTTLFDDALYTAIEESRALVDGRRGDVVDLSRSPRCELPTDLDGALVAARRRFFESVPRSVNRDRVPNAAVGCAEAGSLYVSLGLNVGIGERYASGWWVDTKHRVTRGPTGDVVAHVDLDGDHRRDLVFAKKHQLLVQFAGRAPRSFPIEYEASSNEDGEGGYDYVAAPLLASGFGVVVLRAPVGTDGVSMIERRYQWRHDRFVEVAAFGDPFDAAYERVEQRGAAARRNAGSQILTPQLRWTGCLETADAGSCDAFRDELLARVTEGGIVDPATARAQLLAYEESVRCAR